MVQTWWAEWGSFLGQVVSKFDTKEGSPTNNGTTNRGAKWPISTNFGNNWVRNTVSEIFR